MIKIMNNIAKTNASTINVLNQNIKCKLSSLDELVRVDNLYGIFLNDNRFVVAKEISKKLEYCTTYTLENFFTERLIAYEVVENKSGHVSWKNNEIFVANLDLKAIAFPIGTFLAKHIEKGVTTKRNISILLDTMNEYIKEHPAFVDSLFVENIRKR